MKKVIRLITGILVISAVFSMLSSCGHQHKWEEAACTKPKTCSECGETEGEALGHSWTNATCAAPKTCIRCGVTEGEPLEHTWKEATIYTPKTCAVCGAIDGEPLVWQKEILNINNSNKTIYRGRFDATISKRGSLSYPCELILTISPDAYNRLCIDFDFNFDDDIDKDLRPHADDMGILYVGNDKGSAQNISVDSFDNRIKVYYLGYSTEIERGDILNFTFELKNGVVKKLGSIDAERCTIICDVDFSGYVDLMN